MARKLWLPLLVVGIVGLLLGTVLGRQFQPIQPADGLDIYVGNADATDTETPFSITLPPDASQAAELEQLTTLISRFNFCHLPIEVVNVENNIATINLVEHSWNQDPNNPATFPGCSGTSWRSNYFQGSAGGMITSKTLVYTLLQPDLQEDWIEGVTFQYQGEPIEEGDWEHISLFGVITRESLP
ncbi:MAG: hypothetical protein ACTS2F_30405 [Thainema sp.]